MNYVALTLVLIAVTVVAVTAFAGRFDLPAPLVLMVVGIGISFVPFIPDVKLSAEVVLFGLLPPLLYAAAIRTSIADFRTNVRAIGFLSIALIVITALGVAVVVWWILDVHFAIAFAIGAVVAPPDAVAATAIARRVGLPRRVVTILEGESLLNDATAITSLRIGLLAAAAAITVGDVTIAFLIAAGGGVVVGIVIGFLAVFVRKHIEQPRFDTAISLIVPFAAYVGAEAIHTGEFHGSGVIAVVVAGLILGHKSPIIQTAPARLNERMNWSTIQFLLENSVFLLIGLQAKIIIADLAESPVPVPVIIGVCAAALLTVIVLRLAWVLIGTAFLLRRRSGDRARTLLTSALIIGWAGMRGVVTLAAAFLLPEDIPHRNILVLIAMVVTAGTLLLQGLSLPWLSRRLGLRGPDPREDALQSATVLQSSSNAALEALEELKRDTDSAETLTLLRNRIRSRPHSIWERLGTRSGVETPSEEYRRLRLQTLQTERDEVLRIRSGGKVDHEVIDAVLATLDIEESMLSTVADHSEALRDEPLQTPTVHDEACDHLNQAPTVVAPVGPGGCLDCEREGTRPVHLRLCLACGNIGCCDSSVGEHAAKHYQETGHPVMRSFESGESWRWCYVDQRLG